MSNKLRKVPLLIVLFSAAFFVSCSGVRSGGAKLPALKPIDYKPVKPVEWQLSNGLTVLYLQDKELPLMRGTLFLKGGTLLEPSNQNGVVAVMGSQMRQGGAGPLSADQLDLQLEKLAASIGSDYGGESGAVSFLCLSSDVNTVFPMFADVVRRPRFEQERLDLWKGQAIESIRRRTDDAGTVAGIAMSQLLFGDTPYGKVLMEEDIGRMSRVELLKMHRRFVRPNQAILALTGSVERSALEPLVERYFGDWEPRIESLGELPAIDYSPKPGIYFVPLPFSQSTVYIGEQGPARLSPDYIAIEGFNGVFGSGDFGSRLVKHIRTELGLAYEVYGAIIPAAIKGRNMIVLKTKAESTELAISQSLEMLRDMQSNLVDAQELEEAKNGTENSFIFKVDTPDDAVKRTALLILLDYPKDYDETYMPKLHALNVEEVRDVAKNRWDLSKLVLVVVGNEKAYNSIKELVANPPPALKGLQLQRVTFKQKLQLPAGY